MKFRAFVLFATVLAAFGAVTHKTAPKKTAAVKKGISAAKKGTPAKKKRVASTPRQSAPTPDRYKEIQGALAAKGYLKSEPNGVWDAQSVDAMKRYQSDQKQDPSGRITAASLIGLGLGPQSAALAMPSSAGTPGDTRR